MVLDIWSEGRDKHGIVVPPPASRSDCPVVQADFGDYADVKTPCGDVFIGNMGGPNPPNGDMEAVVLLDDWSGTAPATGDWTVAMLGEEIGQGGRAHGWLADERRWGPRGRTCGQGRQPAAGGQARRRIHAITVGSFRSTTPGTRFGTRWIDVHGSAASMRRRWTG